MAQASGVKRSLPSESDGIQTKTAKTTGSLCDLDENKKRWLLIGTILHTTISPVLRKYVEPRLDQIWQTLKNTDNIDNQVYNSHLKQYHHHGTRLKYEAINNNKVHGRREHLYNYKVTNPVDLSKLFLQTNMAQYSAFDESCDPAALLGIIINTGICPKGADFAKRVRSDVRNSWAHLNSSKWDDAKYQYYLKQMDGLIRSLGLSNQDENQVIKELWKWNINGKGFIAGTTPELIYLKEIRNQEQYLTNKSTVSQQMKGWETDEETFTITRATERVAKLIEKEEVVVVTGSSGSGKSSIIHHVALKLNKERGYDIIPVSSPSEIKQYRDMKKNQVFIVDDICGKNFIDVNDVQTWYDKADEIKQLYSSDNNDEQGCKEEKHGNMKILVSCRLHIFKDSKFKSLEMFIEHSCDLESKEYQLNHDERLKMIKKYTNLSEHDIEILGKTLDKYPYFPLLCKMSKGKQLEQITEISKSPIKSIMNDIKIGIETNNFVFCVLVLCVLFNVGFDEGYINPRTTPENNKNKVTDIVKNFKIDLCVEMERTQLSDTFKRLDGTYIKKTGSVYTIAHDILYDMVAVICGRKLLGLFIRYSPSSLIAEQFRFQCIFPDQNPDEDHSFLYLSEDIETLYFDRVFIDLKERDGKSLFYNQQLEEQSYKDKLMGYIKQNKESCEQLFLELDKKCMKSVINIVVCDDDDDDEDDVTPLIEASKVGFHELFKYLISIKCDINKKDRFEQTPLYYSCLHGDTDDIELCLSEGANIQDALYYACIGGQQEIVEKLITKGGNIQKVISDHKNLLCLVCRGGYTYTLRFLLHSNADVSHCDSSGQTPLYVACDNGHTKTVQLLLDRNADVSQSDRSGRTPLYVACKRGHTNIVRLLLNRNADVSQSDSLEHTPLYVACEGGHTGIVQLLLDRKADVSQCDKKGKFPLYVACLQSRTETVQLLLDRNADVSQYDEDGDTPLFIACLVGQIVTVQLLLDKNADMSQSDKYGHTPLYVACQEGHSDIVKLLLDRHADVSQCDMLRHTPLHAACLSGHTDTVRLVLDRKANVSQCDDHGQTPLHVACNDGDTEIVKLLLDRNADVSQCDIDGETALYVACAEGHTEIVQLLLDRNADPTQKNIFGRTPLDVAYNDSIRHLLKSHLKL